MDLLNMAQQHNVVDKAQGVLFGSAAVQIVSNYATEITLGITLLSFVVMWYYKHKTVKQDEKYKEELLNLKKGEYSKRLLDSLEDIPGMSDEQILLIKKNAENFNQ